MLRNSELIGWSKNLISSQTADNPSPKKITPPPFQEIIDYIDKIMRIKFDEVMAYFAKFMATEEFYKNKMWDDFQQARIEKPNDPKLDYTKPYIALAGKLTAELAEFQTTINDISTALDSIDKEIKARNQIILQVTSDPTLPISLEDQRECINLLEIKQKDLQIGRSENEIKKRDVNKLINDLEDHKRQYGGILPDFLIIQIQSDYVRARANRSPAGIVTNFILNFYLDFLKSKEKENVLDWQEKFLLQVIRAYERNSVCAKQANTLTTPYSRYANIAAAKIDLMKKESLKPVMSKEDIILNIQIYLDSLMPAFKAINDVTTPMQQIINRASVRSEAPLSDIKDRIDVQLSACIQQLKENIIELRTLIKANSALENQIVIDPRLLETLGIEEFARRNEFK